MIVSMYEGRPKRIENPGNFRVGQHGLGGVNQSIHERIGFRLYRISTE
jgi:hypothetical protein